MSNKLNNFINNLSRGGDNMDTDVKNVEFVRNADINDIVVEIGERGLLLRNSGYKILKRRLSDELNMTNQALEVDPETGYYIKSKWSIEGAEAGIVVDYRVPLYTNSQGREVRGKKLSIA